MSENTPAAFRSSVARTSLDEARFASLEGLRPALVVVDVQYDFADPDAIGHMCATPEDLASVAATVVKIDELVTAARAANVPVVWVELSTSNETWTVNGWLRNGSREIGLGDQNPCLAGTPGARWYPPLSPAEGETIVLKDSYSGFIGTNLDAKLNELGIDWLVVTGLTTECCVFSTANDAMQHDYPVVVPRDASASYGAAFHEAALTMLALNSSMVTDSVDVLDQFSRYAATISVPA